MNINATLIGDLILFSVLIGGAISYYLGRRKTETPIITGLIGAVLSIVPPVGLVFIGALVTRKDLSPAKPVNKS